MKNHLEFCTLYVFYRDPFLYEIKNLTDILIKSRDFYLTALILTVTLRKLFRPIGALVVNGFAFKGLN